ncbi:MAG TPA: LPXTG cell wall anchor domain-containing protein [Rubricoccaceae bacterium]|jgi:LPXTG-motif cell wall-anchored protein
MTLLLRALGVLLIVGGTVWIFQGLGVLTAVDSFMIGQTEWIVYGGIAVAAGAGLVLASRRRRAV